MNEKFHELLCDFRTLIQTRSWSGFQQTRGYFACRQVFFYGIIGGGCATLDFLLYLFLSRATDWTPKIFSVVDYFRERSYLDKEIVILLYRVHWNIYIPNFLSINAGICCSFLLNAYFNFRRSDRLYLRAFKFFVIGYCGLFLSMLILRFGVVVLHTPDWAVKIFSVFFVAALQFLLNKFITFNKTKEIAENF